MGHRKFKGAVGDAFFSGGVGVEVHDKPAEMPANLVGSEAAIHNG